MNAAKTKKTAELVSETAAMIGEMIPIIHQNPSLEKNTEKLYAIKKHLQMVGLALSKKESIEKDAKSIVISMVNSSRREVENHYLTLQNQMNEADFMPSDTDLSYTRLIAETFIKSHNEYLRYKEAADGEI